MPDSSRRHFLSTVSRAAVLGGGALWRGGGRAAAAEATGRTRPNFVFFLIDDLGWTDVGCYGSTFYETPGVDRLARMGMRFTDGYAACTVCSPTRASIMTGKYPARLHLTDWISGHVRPWAKLKIPEWTKLLKHKEVTIPEALKPLGYTTGFIGKWHLGPEGYWPDSQGFDVNVGGYSRGSPPSYFAPYRIPTMEEGPEGEYLTDRHAADAERFLTTNARNPFFLYISMYAVHTPLQAKKPLVEKYKAKAEANPSCPQNNPVYGGMVHSMDECVGRVLRKLEELNLLGNTVVMFTGDNGGLIGNPKRPVTSNVPLRAGKGSAYEGGVREPFIIYWPGVTEPGSVCREPVMSIDFYPTILQMAGAKGDPRHNRAVDGVSLVPLLRQSGRPPPRALYWHYPHYHPGGATPYSAIRQGDLKLIEFLEDGRVELYNLRRDIGETQDLAPSMAQEARDLRRALRNWRGAVGAQLPTANSEYDPERLDQRPGARRTGKPAAERQNGSAPDFDVVRGCRVTPSKLGHDLETADEGTALRKCPKPFRKRVVLRARLKTCLRREDGWQNGFLAFSDSGKDSDLVVAGVYIGGLRVSIFDGLSTSGGANVSQAVQFERQATFDVEVTVDLGTRTVALKAAGVEIKKPLPKSVNAVRYVGYHAMQTRTSCGEISMNGE